MPDFVQVLAALAAVLGEAALAALLLGHYRRRLAERGADLPAEAHASWREATRLVDESLAPEAIDRAMTRGGRLTAQEVDAEVRDALSGVSEPRPRTRTA